VSACRGIDHELEEDDDTRAVVDNAWRLAAKLAEAHGQLEKSEHAQLVLFTNERTA
jgi:hypothetical protein